MQEIHVLLSEEFKNLKSFYVKGKLFVNLNYSKSLKGEEIQINTIDLQFKNTQSANLKTLKIYTKVNSIEFRALIDIISI